MNNLREQINKRLWNRLACPGCIPYNDYLWFKLWMPGRMRSRVWRFCVGVFDL